MRTELVRLHNRLDVTTVYVTHDQVEALTMGHRVAVFNQGSLLQVGTPQHLYDAPANVFVASFIGSPRMNLIPGSVSGGERSRLRIDAIGTQFTVEGEHAAEESGAVTLGLRPHDLHLRAEAPPRCSSVVSGLADVVEHTGTELFVEVVTADEVRLMSRMHRSALVDVGQRIELALDPRDLHVFSSETGDALLNRAGGAVAAAARPVIADRMK
jgi:multiple sugar transport system ATP-binding protein